MPSLRKARTSGAGTGRGIYSLVFSEQVPAAGADDTLGSSTHREDLLGLTPGSHVGVVN